MGDVFAKEGVSTSTNCWIDVLAPVWAVAVALLLTWLTSDPGQTRVSSHALSISLPLLVRNVVRPPCTSSHEAKKKRRKFSAVEPWQQHKASPGAGGGSRWLHPSTRPHVRTSPSIHPEQKTRPSLFSTCVLPRLTLPNPHPAPPSTG